MTVIKNYIQINLLDFIILISINSNSIPIFKNTISFFVHN